MKATRYRLITTDDSEKYAVPVARLQDFYDWVASDDWQNGGVPPDYVIGVNGRFTFTDPRNE